MIKRAVRPDKDILWCTDCRHFRPVDHLHHVYLPDVGHRCGDPDWTIPPRPARNKNRGGRP